MGSPIVACVDCARIRLYIMEGYEKNGLPPWDDADERWLAEKHATTHTRSVIL